ncbi:MAG: hypothetical protein RR620_10445 [Clostridium sp.]
MINYILLIMVIILFIRISRMEKKLKEDIKFSKEVVQAQLTSNRTCLKEAILLSSKCIKKEIKDTEEKLDESISSITNDVESTIKGEIVKLAFTPIQITKYKKY